MFSWHLKLGLRISSVAVPLFSATLAAAQFKSEDYYGGLSDKMVGLGPMNKNVPADVVALVEQRRKAILDGSFQVFKGPLADQTGIERVPAGKAMSLKDILDFRWLVKGIEGQAPPSK